MMCPGCGEEMSKIKKGDVWGYECYSCGAYSMTFKQR